MRPDDQSNNICDAINFSYKYYHVQWRQKRYAEVKSSDCYIHFDC